MLDEMRMRTACFARAPQRCASRFSKRFLLIFQEVTPLSKTRNQLLRIMSSALVCPSGLFFLLSFLRFSHGLPLCYGAVVVVARAV